MFDFNKLEEIISVEEHKDYWKTWYTEEVDKLKEVFELNVVEFEHIGSSAVENLNSKPIVDIMVGLKEFIITEDNMKKLERLDYEFFGQLHENQQRMFARKRGKRNFNLAIVKHENNIWNDQLLFRDFLRTHPEKVLEYGNIKNEAINLNKKSLLEYHKHKESVVLKILTEAREWKEQK